VNALIVVPVFNEADTVAEVVRGARAYAPVLVVDDGSRDESAEIARLAGAEVRRHPRRLGKGAAIRTGIEAARARGATVVVTLDGDGQHRPADLDRVLDAARTMPQTIVIGGRLGEPNDLPPARMNAIRVAGFFVNWACGLSLQDTQSGFRAYPVRLFDEVRLERSGFVLETEVLVAAATRGWRVHEVPIAALPRTRQRSRFRPISDGIAIGGYIATRVATRWAVEAGALVGALVTPFLGERRRARHAATMEQISVYAGNFGLWATALGNAAIHHVLNQFALWRSDPRPRRALVAAPATAASPVLIALLLAQTFAPRSAPDFVSPLVRWLCSQERLDGATERVAPVANPVGPPR
jgi:Glycosyl transferase family 2